MFTQRVVISIFLVLWTWVVFLLWSHVANCAQLRPRLVETTGQVIDQVKNSTTYRTSPVIAYEVQGQRFESEPRGPGRQPPPDYRLETGDTGPLWVDREPRGLLPGGARG